MSAACQKQTPTSTTAGAEPSPINALRARLTGQALADQLVQRGPLHIETKTHFRIQADPPEVAPNDDDDTPDENDLPGVQDVTTEGTIDIDESGHFRIHELNDHEGGRDIVSIEDQLTVALRYSQPITRAAKPDEAMRLLAQALGGPEAILEVFHTQLKADAALSKLERQAANEPEPQASPGSMGPLAKWRSNAKLTQFEAQLDWSQTAAAAAGTPPESAARPERIRWTGSFTAEHGTHAIQGAFEVFMTIEATAVTVAVPESAMALPLRQRTILEERALLEGLQSP